MITLEDGTISQLTFKPNTLQAKLGGEGFANKLSKLDNKYTLRVRNWLVSKGKTKFKPKPLEDFMLLSDSLTEVLINLENVFEDPEILLAYQDKLNILSELMPVNQSVSLFGVDDRPPSSFEQKKWLNATILFKSPETILSNLEAGVLTGNDVDLLEALYPSILLTIQEALVEGIAELRGKGISGLGLTKMNLINKLLQVPRLSPVKLEGLQEKFRRGSDISLPSMETEIQRIESRK